MNPKLKTGIIITCVSAVTVGAVFGIKKYKDSTATIEVQSVSALNIGYMDNPMTSTGFVSDSDSQSIPYSSTKTITNVYVTQGQEVSAGDPLLSYDLTSLNLAVESDQIAVEKAKNTLDLAQHELKKLQNTTPDPDPTPTPSDSPEPTEDPDSTPEPVAPEVPDAPEADANGIYPYIVSLDQAENGIESSTIEYCTKEAVPDPTPTPTSTPDEASDPSESEVFTDEEPEEETQTETDSESQTYHAPSTPTSEDSDWTVTKPKTVEDGKYYWYKVTDNYKDGGQSVKIRRIWDDEILSECKSLDKLGSKDNPYVFKLSSETVIDEETGETQEGYVYGKLLNDLKETEESNNEKIYVRFEVYNSEDPTELVTSWEVEPSKFKEKTSCFDTDRFGVVSHSILEYVDDSQSEEETEEETEEEGIDYSGYTAAQLANAIRDKQQEIKSLDLDYRKAKLTLADDQALLSDGVVYAKRSGVVRKVSDVDNPPTDGSSFLEIASGTGLSISGTVSELALDQVKVGDTITGYSWNSGETYTAEVISVDTYPSDDGYYNGTGNPNVSYYGISAYVDDSSNLSVGDYLELTFSSNSENSSIWLSNAYIRKDGKQSYVYKDDGNGKLIKQYIETGSVLWGEYVEVKSGITESDYIAFPYSKNAKDGTKTTGVEDIYAEEASYD